MSSDDRQTIDCGPGDAPPRLEHLYQEHTTPTASEHREALAAERTRSMLAARHDAAVRLLSAAQEAARIDEQIDPGLVPEAARRATVMALAYAVDAERLVKAARGASIAEDKKPTAAPPPKTEWVDDALDPHGAMAEVLEGTCTDPKCSIQGWHEDHG